MSADLSPQNEQFIQEVVASGSYPSRAAALNAAVDLLKHRQMELVEQVNAGIAEAENGEVAQLDVEQIKRMGWKRLVDECLL